MKPFLGIDLTQDKENEQVNGTEFLAVKPSAALAQTLEASTEEAAETVQNAKVPLPFRIAQYVFGFIALSFIGGLLKSDVSLAQGYQNAPELYWIAGISAVTWLILWLWGLRKSKTVLSADESEQTFSHWEGTANAVFAELGVPDPEETAEVDVLSFFYVIKDGEIKVREKTMQLFQYNNLIFRLFADEEFLYLVNLEGKFAFPLSSITAIRTVKKHIRLMSWNKDVAHNKGIYKPYKLTTDNYGCIHCKQYHIVEFNHKGETWGIYIPNYELPAFEAITGLKAQAE